MDRSQARSRMRSYERQMGQHRRHIATLDAKIQRLWDAYNRLGSLGDKFEGQVRGQYIPLTEHGMWSGTLRDAYTRETDEIFTVVNSYMAQVDAARDTIRDEIRRLEDQKTEDNGAIGNLQRAWNGLWSWLQQNTN